MLGKYHVNPETGAVGRCRALFNCRFTHAENHFDNEADARAAYESVQRGQLFSSFSKAPQDEEYYTEEQLEKLSELFTKSTLDKLDYDEISIKDGRSEDFQESYKRLPQDYKIALGIYTNEEQSKIVNALLLGRKSAIAAVREQGLWNDYRKAIAYLDNYLKQKSKKQSEVLYKGVSASSQLEMDTFIASLKNLKPGAELSFKTYLSTSVSFYASTAFMDSERKIVYEIVKGEGAYINHPAEEVLLPRSSKFRFLSFEQSDDMMDYVIVRLAQE